MASLRAAVIAKAFLILSSPRLEAPCVGEAGINMLCRKEDVQEEEKNQEVVQAPIQLGFG